MFTLEESALAWEKATNAGTLEERIIRNEGWNIYYSNIVNNQEEITSPYNNIFINVVNFLLQQNSFDNSSTIIDIGCGTGNYSKQFAKYAKKVTALDMNKDSLKILANSCKNNEIKNIKIQNEMWETYHKDQKYNLVFSSMCPAICNLEELQKMEKLSNKYCAILTIAKGSKSNNRSDLRKLITNEKLKGLASEGIYIYNCLYAMGRHPNIKTYSQKIKSKISSDKAKEDFMQYFSIFGFCGNKEKNIIKNYVDANSVNGYLNDESKLNTVLIYWKVEE